MTISRESLAVFAQARRTNQSWILIADCGSRPPQESSRRWELNAHGYGATFLDWYSMSGSFFVPHDLDAPVLGAASGPLAGKRHSEMQHSPPLPRTRKFCRSSSCWATTRSWIAEWMDR
jgi:hypothetical protein